MASYQGRHSTDVMHTTDNHIIKLYTKTRFLLLSIAVDLANAAVEELKSEKESDNTCRLTKTKTQGLQIFLSLCSPFD